MTATSPSGRGRSDALERKTATEERIRTSVRALRSAHRLSAEELAESLGISRASLFGRLKGDRNFTSGEVEILADYFGVTLTDLVSGRPDLMATGPRAVPDPTSPGPGLPDLTKGSCSIPISTSVSTWLELIPTPCASVENLDGVAPRQSAHAA